ncbi:hypothetical protein DL93DRAFT_2077405 [Clavulina sp. PMI_390]|nr:hypothetical protein DL93DRAFT_2077405 [Clavulina sp. PMI_390]
MSCRTSREAFPSAFQYLSPIVPLVIRLDFSGILFCRLEFDGQVKDTDSVDVLSPQWSTLNTFEIKVVPGYAYNRPHMHISCWYRRHLYAPSSSAAQYEPEMIGSLSVDICSGDINDWFALSNPDLTSAVGELCIWSRLGASSLPSAHAVNPSADLTPLIQSAKASEGQVQGPPQWDGLADAGREGAGSPLSWIETPEEGQTYAWRIQLVSLITAGLLLPLPGSLPGGSILYRLEYDGQVQFLSGEEGTLTSWRNSHTFIIEQPPVLEFSTPMLNIDVLHETLEDGSRPNQITSLGRAEVPQPILGRSPGAEWYEVIDDEDQLVARLCVQSSLELHPAPGDGTLPVAQRTQRPMRGLPPSRRRHISVWSTHSPSLHSAPRWGSRSSIWK